MAPPARYTGKWRDWNHTGQLTRRAAYVAGRLKEYTLWSEDGKITNRGWITARGVHLGTEHRYHPNGRPAAEFHIRNEYRYGKATWWNPSGIRIAEGAYINERRWHGTFLLYDEVSHNHIVERYEEGRLRTQTLLGPELSERAP